jgi:hypothetical protein
MAAIEQMVDAAQTTTPDQHNGFCGTCWYRGAASGPGRQRYGRESPQRRPYSPDVSVPPREPPPAFLAHQKMILDRRGIGQQIRPMEFKVIVGVAMRHPGCRSSMSGSGGYGAQGGQIA